MDFYKKYHRWGGILFSFFIMMSAWSGIVMNHRKVFSGIDVSRNALFPDFWYDNWNNASVKGSLKLSADSVLLYGGSGIWLTDSLCRNFKPFVTGIKKGADNRITGRMVQTPSNAVFAITTFDLYRLTGEGAWESQTARAGLDDRIADLEYRGDTLVVMTRSHLFYSVVPYNVFTRIELPAPAGYRPETGIFRAMWLLHSGGIWGTPGKLFVDFLGVLLIVISITGILYFISPRIIRRMKRKQQPYGRVIDFRKKSYEWHNRLGVVFLAFFLILTLSGMFLRPPLLIAVIKSSVPNIPGTALNSLNPWHEKLRTIRYDRKNEKWMLYTSSGFYSVSPCLGGLPIEEINTPPVSVMGVTVLEPSRAGWIVGSFNGLYDWDTQTGKVTDCYSGQPVVKKHTGRPVSSNPISGYSSDFGYPVAFEYQAGACTPGLSAAFVEMPDHVRDGRISLWHLALEVHTGRIYSVVIGSLTDWYVPVSGMIVLFILVSGYIIYRRRRKVRIK